MPKPNPNQAAATHVKKLQPHSPPSPGLPPISPPSPPVPPATPPPPIHPGGPIPDAIGTVGLDALGPLELDGASNALSLRLNETVGRDTNPSPNRNPTPTPDPDPNSNPYP